MTLKSLQREARRGLVSARVTQLHSPSPHLGESDSALTVHHRNQTVESKRARKAQTLNQY